MSLPQQTQVLIVGGGPTGMVCALTLHQQGIKDICIVDGMQQRSQWSKALAVHAATLEVRFVFLSKITQTES